MALLLTNVAAMHRLSCSESRCRQKPSATLRNAPREAQRLNAQFNLISTSYLEPCSAQMINSTRQYLFLPRVSPLFDWITLRQILLCADTSRPIATALRAETTNRLSRRHVGLPRTFFAGFWCDHDYHNNILTTTQHHTSTQREIERHRRHHCAIFIDYRS